MGRSRVFRLIVVSLACALLGGCEEEEELVTGFSCDFEGRCPGTLACTPDFTCEPAEPECELPDMVCAQRCVDLQTNEAHCGACGHGCGLNETCAAGTCAPLQGNMSCTFCGPGVPCINGVCDCQERGQLCSLLCVDTTQLAFSCGDCFAACPNAGEVCRAGACACPTGERLCGMSCTEILTDPTNCGGCGVVCGAGLRCEAGQCVASCGQAQSCSSDRCYDVANDPKHCGSSCRSCDEGAICSGGVCSCPPGAMTCNQECVDTTRDARHCGACGASCAAGEECVASACTCQPGLTRCGSTCTQPLDDPDNCGACGQACGPGQLCGKGQCVSGCALGMEACETERLCRSGLNPFHCGGCDTTCDPGETCIDDSCETVRPAPECTACPCDACDDDLCCLRGGKPTCVSALRCPQ